MTARKFKIQKDFEPLPVEEGEEFFPNGIFEFNVTKLIAFIKDNPAQFPVERIEVASLPAWGSSHLDEKAVETANLEVPIILAEISPNAFNVVDGNHRVEKARRIGQKLIPAFRVRAEQHLPFLTSTKAYEAYIDYWNSKIVALRRSEVCRRKNSVT